MFYSTLIWRFQIWMFVSKRHLLRHPELPTALLPAQLMLAPNCQHLICGFLTLSAPETALWWPGRRCWADREPPFVTDPTDTPKPEQPMNTPRARGWQLQRRPCKAASKSCRGRDLRPQRGPSETPPSQTLTHGARAAGQAQASHQPAGRAAAWFQMCWVVKPSPPGLPLPLTYLLCSSAKTCFIFLMEASISSFTTTRYRASETVQRWRSFTDFSILEPTKRQSELKQPCQSHR